MGVVSVRIMLVIYSVLAAFSVFLLWRNAAAPDALKSTGIVVASLLTVLISILPYVNPQKLERTFLYVLLYDANEKKIVSGDLSGWYTRRYLSMLPQDSVREAYSAEDFREFIGPKGLDVIEKGIIQTIMFRFFVRSVGSHHNSA